MSKALAKGTLQSGLQLIQLLGLLLQLLARMLALHAQVRSGEGLLLSLRADTLCLHGDRDDAATFARALREGLAADGVDILPFTAETGMRH